MGLWYEWGRDRRRSAWGKERRQPWASLSCESNRPGGGASSAEKTETHTGQGVRKTSRVLRLSSLGAAAPSHQRTPTRSPVTRQGSVRPPSSSMPRGSTHPSPGAEPPGCLTLWYQTLHRLGFLESTCGASCSHSLGGPATVRAEAAAWQQHRDCLLGARVSRGRLRLWGCSWRIGTNASWLLTRSLQPLGQS